MLFELSSGLTHLVYIIRKDDIVGVTHRDEHTLVDVTMGYE